MPSPIISVIIPIYNSERFLHDCITSVRQQTFKDIEIICVNDGSTDESAALLEALAQEDERIQVVYQDNGGVTRAREKGLKYSSGEYIYFLDSDDLIHYLTLEKLINIAKEKNADIVSHRHQNIAENTLIDIVKIDLPNEKITQVAADKAILNKQLSIFLWGKLYKRTLFDGFTFPNMSFAEDLYITPILAMKANRIFILKEKLCFYRQHQSSLTGQFNETKLNSVFENGLRMIEVISKEHYNPTSIKRIKAYFVHYQLFGIVNLLLKNTLYFNLRYSFIQHWRSQQSVNLENTKGLKKVILYYFTQANFDKAHYWMKLYHKIKL